MVSSLGTAIASMVCLLDNFNVIICLTYSVHPEIVESLAKMLFEHNTMNTSGCQGML